jgi:hypothetical protein
MNYEELSDFKINKAVAGSLGHLTWYEEDRHGYYRKDHPSSVWVNYEPDPNSQGFGPKDYCNNPSDAWPIIVGNCIGIYPNDSDDFVGWVAYSDQDSDVDNKSANPLRAAMIVFLKMKELPK